MAAKVHDKEAKQKLYMERIHLPVFDVFILKDGQRYMAKCPQLDLVTEEDTKDKAFQSVRELMKEYAEDYVNRLDIFRASQNRAHHYPYIMEITKCSDDWELLQLLEVKYGSVYV